MEDLQTLITTTQDTRELKRALAVLMTSQGRARADVAHELGYSVAWVDKWRGRYAKCGAEALRVGYKGSTGYLTAEQRAEIGEWLHQQTSWSVPALAAHITGQYGVTYQSDRSYHAILKAARFSWKKTQHAHPEPNEDEVTAAKATIKKNADGSPRPGAQRQCAVDGG